MVSLRALVLEVDRAKNGGIVTASNSVPKLI